MDDESFMGLSPKFGFDFATHTVRHLNTRTALLASNCRIFSYSCFKLPVSVSIIKSVLSRILPHILKWPYIVQTYTGVRCILSRTQVFKSQESADLTGVLV